MLKSIDIRDFALIHKTTVEWTKGLNVLTGETGAVVARNVSVTVTTVTLAAGAVLSIGGNLVVGKRSWEETERTFLAMGFDRAFPPGTRTDAVIDALLTLYDEGSVRPGAAAIAERPSSGAIPACDARPWTVA